MAVLFTGWQQCVLTACAVRMAALWYNLPNYLSSILPCIIPLSAAAGEEIGFVHVERQQLHPLKQTTTSAHLPSPSLFFVSLPLFSLSLSGGQVTLNYSSVWNEKAHGYWISPLKWWPTLCFFSSLLPFFLQLKRVKSGRSHCQGISKVNRLLCLTHIFTFLLVCGQWGGTGERKRTEKKIEEERRRRKGMKW